MNFRVVERGQLRLKRGVPGAAVSGPAIRRDARIAVTVPAQRLVKANDYSLYCSADLMGD